MCSAWWAARGVEVELDPSTVAGVLRHRGHRSAPHAGLRLWRAVARVARALWEACGLERPAYTSWTPPRLPALTWATAPGGVRRPVVDALLQVYPSPEAAAAWCGWAEVPRDERRPVQADLARCLLREARWPEWAHRGARGVLRAAESGRPWGGRLWRLMAPGEVLLVPPATPVGGRLPGVDGWWVR